LNADRWLGVELRHLATLSAIVREGSFRGAAGRLGYAQSAVSQHVAELERAVGCRLVERTRGRVPVEATPAGALLAARAEHVLVGVAATKTELARLDRRRPEVVRLGVVGRAAPMLPRFVEAANQAEELTLEAHESPTDDVLFDQVRDGDLDLTLAEYPAPAGPFAGVELLSSEWVVLVPHGMDAPEPLSLRDVACMSLIGGRRSRAHSRAEDRLRQLRPDARLTFRSDSADRVVALVEARVGVALVPRIGVEHQSRVAIVELQEQPPPFTLGLFWHAQTGLRPVVERLRAAIERDVASTSPDPLAVN
jgi:DNA-binding transcriptional LysR family regulator